MIQVLASIVNAIYRIEKSVGLKISSTTKTIHERLDFLERNTDTEINIPILQYNFNGDIIDSYIGSSAVARGWLAYSSDSIEGYSLNTYGKTSVDIKTNKLLPDTVTICFSVKKSDDYDMMFGAENCGLMNRDGKLGFHTGNSDIYGIDWSDMTELHSEWIKIAVVFVRNNIETSKLYINGDLMELSKQRKKTFKNERWKLDSTLRISGWLKSNSYEVDGLFDTFSIYGKELSVDEIAEIE